MLLKRWLRADLKFVQTAALLYRAVRLMIIAQPVNSKIHRGLICG
jgi:hypothetical protein